MPAGYSPRGNQAEMMMRMGNAKQQQQQNPAMMAPPPGRGGVIPPSYMMNHRPSSERRADLSPASLSRYEQQQQQQQYQQQQQQQQQQRQGPPPMTRTPSTKAQNYARGAQMAARAASPANSRSSRSSSRQPPSSSSPRQKAQARPRKQRIVTPEMIARRPIEQKHNIMMRSAGHNAASDVSVDTEVTEMIQNNKMANSRRKRDSKVRAYMPTLETVDTLESKTTFESKENPNPNVAKAGRASPRTDGSASGGSDGSNAKKGVRVPSPRTAADEKKFAAIVAAAAAANIKKQPPSKQESPVVATTAAPTAIKPPLFSFFRGNNNATKAAAVAKKDQEDKAAATVAKKDQEDKAAAVAKKDREDNAAKKDQEDHPPNIAAKKTKKKKITDSDLFSRGSISSASSSKNSDGEPVLPSKKSSLIAVAEYPLSNSSTNKNTVVETNDLAETPANDHDVTSMETFETEVTLSAPAKDNDVMMSPETFETNDHDVVSLETFETLDSLETFETLDTLITIEPLKAAPSHSSIKTDIIDNINNSNANRREVKTPRGTTLLTINTDLLSPAQPSSVLSPVNKEDVEIQLPTPVPVKGNNERGSDDDKAESGLPAPATEKSVPLPTPAVAPVASKKESSSPAAGSTNEAVEPTFEKVSNKVPTLAPMASTSPAPKKKIPIPSFMASTPKKKAPLTTPPVASVVSKKEISPSPVVAPPPVTSKKVEDIDTKLEKSNARVDRLKKELLSLARPNFKRDSSSVDTPSSKTSSSTPQDAVTKKKEISDIAQELAITKKKEEEEASAEISDSTKTQEESEEDGISRLSQDSGKSPFGLSHLAAAHTSSPEISQEESSNDSPSPAMKPDAKASKKKKTVAAAAAVPVAKDKATKTKAKKSKDKLKKKRPVLKSFLGKKSKVIEEETEFVAEEEDEERDNVDEVREEINDREEAPINEEYIHEREAPEDQFPVVEERRKSLPPICQEEESEESDLSIDMKSTLSNAEFISVQSEITTDQEAFAYKPSLKKRTASLVKKPGLALRGHRTRSTAKASKEEEQELTKQQRRKQEENRVRLEEEELMKRMKHARTLARADNRKKEKLDVDNGNDHPMNKEDGGNNEGNKKDVKTDEDDDTTPENSDETEIQSGEMEQLQEMLVYDDTMEDTIAVKHKDTMEDTASSRKHTGLSYVASDDEDEEADSMYNDNDLEENDMLLTSKSTFDDTLTRKQRQAIAQKQQQKQQQVRFEKGHAVSGGTQTSLDGGDDPIATYPVIRAVSSGIGQIGRTPSKEISTQTSDDQAAAVYQNSNVQFATEDTTGTGNINNNSSHETGSFGRMMEAVGLYGAQICMGTSSAMLSCADSCSDNPHGKKVVLVSDNDLVERTASPRNVGRQQQQQRMASPRNAAMRQQQQQFSETPNAQESIFRTGCGAASSGDTKTNKEEEAAGIFTRALALALQTTVGGEERIADQGVVSPSHNNSPQQHGNNGNNGNNGNSVDMYPDAFSVDGRFVTPKQQQQNRQRKRVPRNIAVKPKKENNTAQQQLYEDDEVDELPELKRTNSLKRVGSFPKTAKKGIGKFFKKLTKAKFAVMYEV